MRYLIALASALALVSACSRGDRGVLVAGRDSAIGGPRATDALVLRVARRGGPPRVTTYANLDSTIWTGGEAAPALDHVLAFDDDAGLVAFVDARGLPGRIDLRLGTVSIASRAKLHELASVDAAKIYGLGPDGAVVRLTPEGDWVFKPPRPARDVFPLRDGSVLILGGRDETSALWRIRPPESKIVDSLPLPGITLDAAMQMGGRLYFVAQHHALVGVATRVLQTGPEISLDRPIAALAATPSGDRLYVAADSTREITVVDRYRDRVATRIELPGSPRDVRIDPLGRFLLVRAAGSDSVWIIAVGTDRVVGSTRSTWRQDLPFVAADGAIGVAQGADVVFVDAATGRERRRVARGAADFWYPFQWTGFRPRAAGLDQPVDFARRDTADTVRRVAPTPPPAETVATKPVVPPDTTARGFVVSFAALLTEPPARELAAQIKVRGQSARVVPSDRDGTTIYRVLLGPYPTREDADRAGRESGQDYWVYQTTP